MTLRFGKQEDGSEIILTSPSKITGTYSVSGSNYTLTAEGNIGVFEVDTTRTGINTGTWSREGNILTLNSDNSSSIAFKKK